MSPRDRHQRPWPVNNGQQRRPQPLPPEFRGGHVLGQEAPAVALDRMGREITQGCLVVMEHNATEVVFEVMACDAITLPNVEGGAMQLLLSATVPITMNRGVPSPRLFVVQGPPTVVAATDDTGTEDPPPPPSDPGEEPPS